MNPIQIQIQKYFEYCMGNGYLNKSAYANDLANVRSQNRLIEAAMDRLMAAQKLKEAAQNQPLPQQQPQTPAQPNAFLRVFQAVTQPVVQMFSWVFTAGQSIALATGNTVGRTVGALEQAFSKVLSFFFGFKKDKNDEKEKRERDDFAETDLFTRRVVDDTQGSGHGSAR